MQDDVPAAQQLADDIPSPAEADLECTPPSNPDSILPEDAVVHELSPQAFASASVPECIETPLLTPTVLQDEPLHTPVDELVVTLGTPQSTEVVLPSTTKRTARQRRSASRRNKRQLLINLSRSLTQSLPPSASASTHISWDKIMGPTTVYGPDTVPSTETSGETDPTSTDTASDDTLSTGAVPIPSSETLASQPVEEVSGDTAEDTSEEKGLPVKQPGTKPRYADWLDGDILAIPLHEFAQCHRKGTKLGRVEARKTQENLAALRLLSRLAKLGVDEFRLQYSQRPFDAGEGDTSTIDDTHLPISTSRTPITYRAVLRAMMRYRPSRNAKQVVNWRQLPGKERQENALAIVKEFGHVDMRVGSREDARDDVTDSAS
jgi:hypothetical protein